MGVGKATSALAQYLDAAKAYEAVGHMGTAATADLRSRPSRAGCG